MTKLNWNRQSVQREAKSRARTLAGPVTVTRADGSVRTEAPETFLATRSGKCRICTKAYHPGDEIWAPMPGAGANHKACLG